MNLSKKNATILVAAAMGILVSITIVFFTGYLSLWKDKPQITTCAQYSSETRTITVTCDFTLTEVHNAIADDSILKRETSDGVWFLNSSIIISKGAVLTISPSEARWIKINSEDRSFEKSNTTPHFIDVYGGFNIQGIRVTSWNPLTNNYTYQKPEGTVPRPTITVQDGADPSHISNSEIAYLGYNSSRKHGLSFYGGDRSILSGNRIHDLWFGFFSTNVGHIVMENNDVYNNVRYGIDPHEGSHDFIIRGNHIYNSRIGLICSLQCSNMLFENNRIESNNEVGILFSRDTVNSIARYNTITLSDTGISVSESHSNKIYRNTLFSNDYGVAIKNDSFENLLLNNTISDPTECGIVVSLGGRNNTVTENRIQNYKQSGICLSKANQNTFYSNIVDGLGKYAIDVRHQGIGNSFSDNAINLASNAIRVYNNTGSLFVNNKVGNTNGHQYIISGNSTLNLVSTRFVGDTIRAAGTDTNTVRIWNSGFVDVVTERVGNDSNISIYNTDVEPYIAKLSYVTINLYSKIN